jgi:hypothetical protein
MRLEGSRRPHGFPGDAKRRPATHRITDSDASSGFFRFTYQTAWGVKAHCRDASCARVMHKHVAQDKEGAGNAGASAHPQPCVQNKKHASKSPQVHRNDPAFPAQWF